MAYDVKGMLDSGYSMNEIGSAMGFDVEKMKQEG